MSNVVPIPNVTLAQLQARCDGGSFAVTTATGTPLLKSTHPDQALFPTSASSPRIALTWSARFRGRPISGAWTLVADAGFSAYAMQVFLNRASTELDVVDMRLGTQGRSPGPDLTG